MGPFAAAPEPAMNLVEDKTERGSLSWTPGKDSRGSLVMVWTGNPVLRQAPANSLSYKAGSEFGRGDTMPSTNCYLVFSGSGNKVKVTGLPKGETYHAAVFSFTGVGKTITYSHSPAVLIRRDAE
jgi:hypothetical protein